MIELFEKLYKKDDLSFYEELKNRMVMEQKTFLVTANPEIFSRSQKDKEVAQLLLDENTMISPDGEGIVKACQMLDIPIWGKIAGVDTVSHLLEFAHIYHKKVYFYGSKQEVLEALHKKINKTFPDLLVCGLKNGYDNQGSDIIDDMLKQQPDLILIALGVPRQEKFIYQNLDKFDKGIFIGVGGSLDVLSGTKKRAPKLLIKCKLEWAYRLLKEPKRIRKFCDTHIGFMREIRTLAKHRKV